MQTTVSKKMNLGSGVLIGQDIKLRRNVRDMSFIYMSVLGTFGAVAVVVFAFLWSRLMVVNTAYEISKANTERSALIEHNKRLRIEFMELKSPDRIEKIAREELQLVNPSSEQIVTVR